MKRTILTLNVLMMLVAVVVTVAVGGLATPQAAYAQEEECGVVNCTLGGEECLCCLQRGAGGCDFIGNEKCGAELCAPAP